MTRRFAIHMFGLLVLACIVALASGASAASWSSFNEAQFTGITLDKPLQVDVLDYTLTLSTNPTITVSGQTYQVNWIQSFYVLADKPGGSFTATNGQGNGWGWDSKTSGGGQISGWSGQGNNRILPGGSRTFHFATFDPRGNPVAQGFHVSFNKGPDVVTGWYALKYRLPPSAVVPEPSSMICLVAATVGFAGLVLRRRTTSN